MSPIPISYNPTSFSSFMLSVCGWQSLHNTLPRYFTLGEMAHMQLNEYNREQIHHKNEATGLHFEHTSQLKAFIF